MSSSIPALAKPRVFHTSGFDIIDASDRVEEETLPTYAPDKYYPIHIGEPLDARYQAWDIVYRRTLFPGQNTDGIFDDRVHLAEMVALLGLPPAEFGKRSRVGHVFFDNDGRWKDLAPVPNITLDRLAADIQGDDKDGFLLFL
ncbi:hypothetical protein APSETT445_004243 [Aspergillus pseudonomiae]